MFRKTIKQLNQALINKEFTQAELIQAIKQELINTKEMYGSVNALVDAPLKDNYDYQNNLLAGIPFANKDNFATKDVTTTSSSRILENFVPAYNSTLIKQLSDSDVVMVCKTNMDEFGMGGTNLNTIFGPTHNPWNLSVGTGGSSGGSAALVASGIIPFATGSDTGDSVRKPAAYCGIYGYKPTWGTISRYGIFPYASSLDTPGFFARCIDDLAIVSSVVNGPDTKDATSMIVEKKDYYTNIQHPTKLKIGYIKELIDTFDNPTVQKQFEETLNYLKSLGHEIVELNLDINLLRCIRGVYHSIANAEGSSNLASLTGVVYGERIEGKTWEDSIIETRNHGISKYSKARLCIGAFALKESNRDIYYIKAKQIRTKLIKSHLNLFEQVDLLVNPSANSGAYAPLNDTREMSEDANLVAENYLSLANIIGAPGLTIPTHIIDNLPYGSTFMAKPYDDQLIFNFGKQFEDGLLDNNFEGLISFYNRYAPVKEDN